jgi:hypothetical protein
MSWNACEPRASRKSASRHDHRKKRIGDLSKRLATTGSDLPQHRGDFVLS